MQKGRAPVSFGDGRVGGRTKFEIHHIKLISKGGEVYNVDNMGVVTPKRHIEIHLAGSRK